MHELSLIIVEIISDIDKRLRDFDFKRTQIDGDIQTIAAILGDRSDKGAAFIDHMKMAQDKYRDAIDCLQIAKQRLEYLKGEL